MSAFAGIFLILQMEVRAQQSLCAGLSLLPVLMQCSGTAFVHITTQKYHIRLVVNRESIREMET